MKSMYLFFLVNFSPGVIFNEIMYDPLPSVNLPGYEYLELFNNSNSDIDIGNWIINSGSSEILIPGHRMKSGEYLLLVYPGSSCRFNFFTTKSN